MDEYRDDEMPLGEYPPLAEKLVTDERAPVSVVQERGDDKVYLVTRFDQTELTPRQALAAGIRLMHAAAATILP